MNLLRPTFLWAPFILSVSILIGWIFHIESLVILKRSWIPMQFNTAICFILIFFSINFAKYRRFIWIANSINTFVFLFSFTIIMEYLLGFDTIDYLFINPYEPFTTNMPYPGRPALHTAFSFICLVFSFTLLNLKKKRLLITSILALFPFYISIIAILGYLMNFKDLYTWGTTPIALRTSFCLLCYSLVIFSSVNQLGKVTIVNKGELEELKKLTEKIVEDKHE